MAAARGWIPRKPKIEHRRESQHRVRWYTEEEEQTFLDHFRSLGKDWLADLMVILLDTGLRVSETLGLKWRDIEDGWLRCWVNKADHPRSVPLFAIAKGSVDQELGMAAVAGAPQQSSQPSGAPAPGHTGPASNGNSTKPATDAQLRAIWAICNQLGIDQDAEAQRTFQRPVSQLTVPEASQLIDHLKQVQGACGSR